MTIGKRRDGMTGKELRSLRSLRTLLPFPVSAGGHVLAGHSVSPFIKQWTKKAGLLQKKEPALIRLNT